MNEAIRVFNGKLFFGKHEVRDYELKDGEPICQFFEIRVPEIRVKLDGTSYTYWRLATTMDIPDDGDSIWLCEWELSKKLCNDLVYIPSAYYDGFHDIEDILNRLCEESAGKEWVIFADDYYWKKYNNGEDDWDDDDE